MRLLQSCRSGLWVGPAGGPGSIGQHARGLPKAIRTDNGKELCSRAMLSWSHARGVWLFLIEPGKPNENAYIESFN